MTAQPTSQAPRTAQTPPPRSRRLMLTLAVLGAVSTVVAALVIFSSGGGSSPQAQEPEAHVRASGQSLLVGRSDAPRKVVVFEDFGGVSSRDFEIGSRDFLRVEASQGKAQVEYRPYAESGAYSRQALRAWAAVLQESGAEKALRFHDELFDRQPSPAQARAGTELEAWAVDAGVTAGLVSDALQQPDDVFVARAGQAARSAGVRTAPTVVVDGTPVRGADGTDLADRLQRTLLGD